MGSKASGEPALLLSVSILHALRAAVKAARQEVGTNRQESSCRVPAQSLKYNRRIGGYPKADSFPDDDGPAGLDIPNLHRKDGTEAAPLMQASEMPHDAAPLAVGNPSSPECMHRSAGNSRAGEDFVPLPGPASVYRLREACGPYSAAKILRAALQEAELAQEMDGWVLMQR
jgi:hypothetical protein